MWVVGRGDEFLDVESYYRVLMDLLQCPLGAVFRREVRLTIGLFEFLFSPFDVFPLVGP